jgi:gamma-glutamyl-gamma-aminobutyrate hydrolase PuuD
VTKKTFQLTTTSFAIADMLVRAGYAELKEDSFLAPDFIVVPGGSDVNPRLYFETRDPKTSFDSRKDLTEISAIMAARLSGIPQLGICRGLQLLHVSTGGTLIQHIEGHNHGQHEVLIGPGKYLTVTSSHHQAVPRDESSQYEEVHHAVDGTVEAVFSESRLIAGVQWHPEYATASTDCRDFFLEYVEKLLAVKKKV